MAQFTCWFRKHILVVSWRETWVEILWRSIWSTVPWYEFVAIGNARSAPAPWHIYCKNVPQNLNKLQQKNVPYLIDTSIIANIRYFPSSGTTKLRIYQEVDDDEFADTKRGDSNKFTMKWSNLRWKIFVSTLSDIANDENLLKISRIFIELNFWWILLSQMEVLEGVWEFTSFFIQK